MGHVLRVGCAACLDSFSGLIPIKVLDIRRTETSSLEVSYEVTRTVGAYKRGDKDTTSSRYAVPTSAIERRGYRVTILPYTVELPV